mmetsp:Transcript_14203/g.44128  ORF Transcript_14203/g.44128 Transcript_14203/m.44128 type:complete len:238 (-) Transcript_14203:7-720(-)
MGAAEAAIAPVPVARRPSKASVMASSMTSESSWRPAPRRRASATLSKSKLKRSSSSWQSASLSSSLSAKSQPFKPATQLHSAKPCCSSKLNIASKLSPKSPPTSLSFASSSESHDNAKWIRWSKLASASSASTVSSSPLQLQASLEGVLGTEAKPSPELLSAEQKSPGSALLPKQKLRNCLSAPLSRLCATDLVYLRARKRLPRQPEDEPGGAATRDMVRLSGRLHRAPEPCLHRIS